MPRASSSHRHRKKRKSERRKSQASRGHRRLRNVRSNRAGGGKGGGGGGGSGRRKTSQNAKQRNSLCKARRAENLYRANRISGTDPQLHIIPEAEKRMLKTHKKTMEDIDKTFMRLLVCQAEAFKWYTTKYNNHEASSEIIAKRKGQSLHEDLLGGNDVDGGPRKSGKYDLRYDSPITNLRSVLTRQLTEEDMNEGSTALSTWNSLGLFGVPSTGSITTIENVQNSNKDSEISHKSQPPETTSGTGQGAKFDVYHDGQPTSETSITVSVTQRGHGYRQDDRITFRFSEIIISGNVNIKRYTMATVFEEAADAQHAAVKDFIRDMDSTLVSTNPGTRRAGHKDYLIFHYAPRAIWLLLETFGSYKKNPATALLRSRTPHTCMYVVRLLKEQNDFLMNVLALEDSVKVHLGSKDKFLKMVEKNAALDLLRDQFNLDIEY